MPPSSELGKLSPEAVCEAFDLGRPVAPLRAVQGGLSHRMWRLETVRGCFAVKELNRKWNNPTYVAGYERAFQIEQAALAAGLPMPRPVPVPGTAACLAELPDGTDRPATVRVHEWVQGRNVRMTDVDPEMAGRIGAVLARIHGLALPAPQSLADILWVWGADHWQILARRVSEARLECAGSLREALPLIEEMEAVVIAARTASASVVQSHGDVNYKNVLSTPERELLLVDWDAAGPCGASHEVACAALDWAGVRAHDPRPDLARALIDGYRMAGGQFDGSSRTVFAFFLRGFLNWLEYLVRRSLGEYLQGAEEREVAKQGPRGALANILRFARSLDAWLPLLA